MEMTDRTRTLAIRAAGAAMLVLAVAAALLPVPEQLADRLAIGLLLALAGIVEMAAVYARRGHHIAAGLAAAVSLIAGLRLALDPTANFFTIFNLVILWLVVRSATLAMSARQSPAPLCNWIWIDAAVDLVLALLLLAGLPVAVLIYGLFGQTSELVATFAWILATSFAASGLLLFAAASDEARETHQASG